jgi:ElaB/YqjD/DUF883 family membrane-anchored ribosome-binding protein
MMNQANDTDAAPGASSATQRQGTTAQVREKVEQALGTAKEKTVTAYSTSKDKAAEALETARERASLVAQRTAEGIDEYPVAALVGGLALGVIAGALLPSTRKEAELLGPLGSKVNDAARGAAQAAREAGQSKLGDLGVNRDSAREQVSKLVDHALKVVGEAGNAAARSVREGGPQA